MIDIKGLDKAKVLHALWHASHAQGMSFMAFVGDNFTLERAEELIKERENIDNDDFRLYFDYVDGHVIKCNISGDEFDPRLFDRDCGEGAAAKAIEDLRNGITPQRKGDNFSEMFRCLASMANDTPSRDVISERMESFSSPSPMKEIFNNVHDERHDNK